MVGESMRRDVHPAEVLLPDGELLRDVRVYVTSHRLLAYGHDPATGEMVRVKELVLADEIPADHGTLPAALRLSTADGDVILNRGAGCGCGSPLKALGTPVPW